MEQPKEPELNQQNVEKVESKQEKKVKEVDPKDLKKQHSYTYWVDDKNKSRELPEQHRPKKIDPPPVTSVQYLQCLNRAGNGPSQWNKLGSWEERAIPTKELN